MLIEIEPWVNWVIAISVIVMAFFLTFSNLGRKK